jgi:hypothetical protein
MSMAVVERKLWTVLEQEQCIILRDLLLRKRDI